MPPDARRHGLERHADQIGTIKQVQNWTSQTASNSTCSDRGATYHLWKEVRSSTTYTARGLVLAKEQSPTVRANGPRAV